MFGFLYSKILTFSYFYGIVQVVISSSLKQLHTGQDQQLYPYVSFPSLIKRQLPLLVASYIRSMSVVVQVHLIIVQLFSYFYIIFSHLSNVTAKLFIAIIVVHCSVLLSSTLNSFLIFFLYLCLCLSTSLVPGYLKVPLYGAHCYLSIVKFSLLSSSPCVTVAFVHSSSPNSELFTAKTFHCF